jgi:hypothetical protein
MSTFFLLLPCGEVHHLPTKDHETVVDIRELLALVVALITSDFLLVVVHRGVRPVK